MPADPQIQFPDLRFPGLVERFGAGAEPPQDRAPGLIVICEHASASLPPAALGGDLGISKATRASHAAYDIGALDLARALATRLAPETGGAVLIHAPLSRLAYDLNRSPDHPSTMPERSEIHEIPGNRGLSAAARRARVDAIYLPFHASVNAEIARALALGARPAILTVHSFTPVFNGVAREVEFGIIHDDDPALSLAILEDTKSAGLVTRLNEPYAAAGGFTHCLRLHTAAHRLAGSMLELRNDLIATPEAAEAMAGRLAPGLAAALTREAAHG